MKIIPSFSLLLVLLSLALASSQLNAQDQSLYEHSVAVDDDSEQSLIDGRREAMEAVLVKVSGDREVLGNAAVASALGDAQSFATRYGFQTGSGDDVEQLYLWAAFDRQAIDKLLAGSGQSQWRGARPDTLVWMASQEGAEPVIVGTDGDSDLNQIMRQRAQQRGLKVVVPLFDLQDQRALSASELWGNSPEVVAAASARYPAGVVLVGRMEPQGSGWIGYWTAYQGAERQDWETRGASREEVVVAALDVHADRLTSVYADTYSGGTVGGIAAGRTLLRVSGIRSLRDYLHVSGYLQRMGGVAAARPAQLNGDTTEFELELDGSVAALQRVLSVEGLLVPLASGAGGGVGGAMLDYQLSY